MRGVTILERCSIIQGIDLVETYVRGGNVLARIPRPAMRMIPLHVQKSADDTAKEVKTRTYGTMPMAARTDGSDNIPRDIVSAIMIIPACLSWFITKSPHRPSRILTTKPWFYI